MLAELLNSPQGQGLLAAAFGAAASARRGAPFNTIGAGGLAGLSAFANAQDRITRQKQDQVRQQYMQGQLEHLNAQTAEQQRKTKTAEEQREWLQTQNPAMLATGGSMAPTTDNAQRLSQVDPRQQQMWDLAARGLLPFDKYLEMTAPQKPQHKVVGNTLLEVGGQGVKPLYTAPDAGKMSPLGQLYAEMEKLPAGSPQRAAYQAAIIKATTHQPASSITNYGSPVPIQLPDGSIGYAQPPNKAGAAPQIMRDPASGAPMVKPKDVPAGMREKLAENEVSIQRVQNALSLLDRNSGSLGAQNYLPDALNQRLDPAGIELRAAVADIGSQKIHDRSGAAVTISEAPRLMPFVPQVTDTPEAAGKKLQRLHKELATIRDELASGASLKASTERRSPRVESSPADPLNLRGKR